MRHWLLLLLPLVLIGCSEPDTDTPATYQSPDRAQPAAGEQSQAEAMPETAKGTQIITEEIEYTVNDQSFTGYIAHDGSIEGKRPGVLVVHEWWGHDEYARSRAEQLAEMGYTAFAMDMYGTGKVTDHPEDAQKFMEEATSDPELVKARFLKARDILENHATTNPDRTAAIGYCFGGGVVLNMARAGVDLDGVASFHGSLAPMFEAERDKVTAQVLVLHGGDDPMIPQEQVEAFKAEMDEANVDYTFIAYPGVTHSFTNPDATAAGEQYDLPMAYDAEADEQSWAELEAFLASLWEKDSADEGGTGQ